MSAASRIEYSEKYADEHHEYRYVFASTRFIRQDSLTLVSRSFARFVVFTQSRNSSQRAGQDSSQEPSAHGERMAQHWSPTKPGLATLRRSSVRRFSVCSMSVTCKLIFALSSSPEPHILLFRRALGTNPQSGRVDPDLVATAKAEFADQMGLLRNALHPPMQSQQ